MHKVKHSMNKHLPENLKPSYMQGYITANGRNEKQ
jgi:hypothetical protein